MSPPQPERIYGVRELTRILTLTPKRAGQLRRLDLLRGDSGYTFRDLLALRAASALLDAGASVRQIRTALTALRRQDPELKQPLAEVRLVLEGDRLVAQSDRVRFDPRTGQMVLALDWGGLEAAATATLATGLVRPLAPPVDQAETWFERASEWDGDPAQWEDAIDAHRPRPPRSRRASGLSTIKPCVYSSSAGEVESTRWRGRSRRARWWTRCSRHPAIPASRATRAASTSASTPMASSSTSPGASA